MKKNLLSTLLWCFFGLFFGNGYSQNIFSGEPVQVVGSFNGYATTPYATDYRTTTYRRLSISSGTPTDGRGQWATTINIQPAGGDATPINMPGGAGNGFLFISGPSANRFQNKWVFSGVGQGTVDGLNVISAFNSGNDMGLNMSTAGYYTFVFNDCGYTSTNGRYYVGYTSTAPVNVTRAAELLNGDGTCTITINPGGAASAEEKFYVRYTTGTDFSGAGTSSLVQASLAGPNYNATIPAQTPYTTVRYYVFSSTRSLAQLTANTEAERSLAVLRYDDNSGANFVYTNAVLPVKITAFTGKAISKTVQLNWQTENEVNMNRYELLRSADGLNYATVYTEAANNTSGTHFYQWVDGQPLQNGFYKIAAVENNSSKQYSNTIRINAAKKLQLNIYPNPVTENLTVSLDAFEKGQIQWVIFNKDGKQMNTAYYNYDGFVNRINIPIPENFQKGVYTLMIQSSKQKLTGEFIVQKLK